MSRLSALALSKRSVVLLLTVAVFLGGIYGWTNLKQELVPDVEFPIITVITPYPGVGANDVADQVTKPIERAISSIPRLERLQSTSANSISIVTAQFSFGTDVKDLRTTIEQNVPGAGLPPGVTPQVTAFNINASPVIIAAISGTNGTSLEDVGEVARTVIVPELAGLDGVSAVDLHGGLEQRAMVTLDPGKLSATGVSATQVAGALDANNLTLPTGQIVQDTLNIPVATTHTYASLDEIAALVVGFRTSTSPTAGAGAGGDTAPTPSTPVHVSDVATVALVGLSTTGYSRTNGDPSITITVSKSSGANTVEVADAVQAQLDDLASRYGDTVKITVITDQSNFIKESRDGLLREGGLGAIFAIATIFLFLFSLRSTIVAAISIPISILAALVLMLVTGISVNILTLGGLAVAVGRVIDDAVVVLENIYRHRARGDDRTSAILVGTREVAGAITSSTITTIAVFLPLGFVGGLVSQFFLPFALTVSFALAASLIVALTVVPVLAYFLVDRMKMDVDEPGEPRSSLWIRIYTPAINVVFRNRRTQLMTVAVVAVLFFVTAGLVSQIPTQFINTGSEKVLAIYLAPPLGTSSAAVLDEATKAEAIVKQDSSVELIQTTVPGEGSSGALTLQASFAGRPTNSALLTVRLDSGTDLTEQTEAFIAALDPIEADGYDVEVAAAGGFGGTSTLTIIVSGEDPEQVADATAAIMEALKAQPDIVNLKSDLSEKTPEVQVAVDPNKAAGIGSSTAQLAAEVRGTLVGQRVSRV